MSWNSRTWAMGLALTASALAADPAISAAASARVRIEGSDTIGGALGIALAEAFHAQHPEALVEWEGLGSSTAFVGLFDGSADLGASSRAITESEAAEAKRQGISLREFVIGYDGIAVIVHPDNPIAALTVQQLSEIFQGRVADWAALGGRGGRIRLVSRPSYSGTHVFFRDKVLRRGNAKGAEQFAERTEWVEHSADILPMVAGDPNAISFVGLGWAKSVVRTVPVAATKGQTPVLPSVATVRDGSYPIYRPLLMYARGEPRGRSGELLDFILGGDGQQIVAENGFVALDSPRPAGATATTAPKTARRESSPGFEAAVRAQAGSAAATGAPTAAAAVAAPGPRLTRVYFQFGGTLLGDEALETLAGAAAELRSGGYRALVVGHADGIGSRQANLKVSQARAEAVRRQLVSMGVPPAMLLTEAAGSDQPIATNQTAAGRRGNRRVDIVPLRASETTAPAPAGSGRPPGS